MNPCLGALAGEGGSSAENDVSVPLPAVDAGPGPGSSWEGPEPIDLLELLDRCMGDRKFRGAVLDLFRSRIGAALEEVDAALRGKDADALARAAHGVRGTAANISARAASRIAARLEEISHGGAASDVELWVAALKQELGRCVAFTRQPLGESDRA